MSHITEVLVGISASNSNEEKIISRINQILKDLNHGDLKELDTSKSGGGKVFCTTILCGAYNYFKECDFLEQLKIMDVSDIWTLWVLIEEEQTIPYFHLIKSLE